MTTLRRRWRSPATFYSASRPGLAARLKPGRGAGAHGLTMAELLIAFTIIAAVFTGLANVSIGQMGYAKRSSSVNDVEAAISQDLAWLRSYARIWKLAEGPYALPISQTKTATYVQSTTSLKYQPDVEDCDAEANIAAAFLEDAASVVTSPVRPFTVPTAPGATTLPLSGDASAFVLTRTISTDGAENNRIRVRYNLTGTDAPPLTRNSSILIEAASWCV